MMNILKQWLTSVLELIEAGIESINETPTKIYTLPLAPQTSRYSSLPDEDQSPFFLHYNQDGSGYYYQHQHNMTDDDKPLGYTRTRYYSCQHSPRPAGDYPGRKTVQLNHLINTL